MESPRTEQPRQVLPGVWELGAWLPVPGHGVLAVNSFVIQGPEPVLVETGLAALRTDWLQRLAGVIDPADLRWIWISHTDPDHLGNLAALLDIAPRAEVVTGFLGMGKMTLQGLPVDRVRLVAPGERLQLPDRELVALRPPYFDAPETLGFLDTRTRALFAADAFGALLPAPVEEAQAIPRATLRDGLLRWSALDAPWLGEMDAHAFGRKLRALEALAPSAILGGHLPAASDRTAELTGILAEAVHTQPTDVPAHELLERLAAAHSSAAQAP
ncbi:MBL fold metallo-hydrolase [Spiribacter halobius]|nr:MBL fold metallo-hydrolase [Spiribacter halobius]UEX79548.1 MBL fold metallo-hydrolase [Spiribacter halobius]